MSSRKDFQVHSHILVQLIKRQAGTFGKAILELSMNAVDAGATSATFTFDKTGFVFEDNGKGFVSEQDIDDLFGTVGWPHKEGDRIYGEFGLGRLQVLNFASTRWLTNGFEMVIDINRNGLSYDVLKGTNNHKGVRIEGTFYEPLQARDILEVTKEISQAVAYAPIPITCNGVRLDTPVDTVKWTHEIDSAFIKLSSNKRDLEVYNQGVYVRSYPSYHFGGMGGVVVTKPGIKLMLNTARNDIITNECPHWKKIKPLLVEQTKTERKKRKSHSDSDLISLIEEFDSGEVTEETYKAKYFRTITGKKMDFAQLLNSCYRNFVFGERSHLALVKAHEANEVLALDNVVLRILGIGDADSFKDYVIAMAEEFAKHGFGSEWDARRLQHMKVYSDITPFTERYSGQVDYIDIKELKGAEKYCFQSLKNIVNSRCSQVVSAEIGQYLPIRQLKVGKLDGARAWTDGSKTIGICREELRKASRMGVAGMTNLANLLIHEYCHMQDSISSDTHLHDENFYSLYHNAVLSDEYARFVTNSVIAAAKTFVEKCAQKGIKLNQDTTRLDGQLCEIEACEQSETENQKAA